MEPGLYYCEECRMLKVVEETPNCTCGEKKWVLKEDKYPHKADASGSNSTAGLSAKRFDYIKKLVSEIDEQVAKEMVAIDGDNCIPQNWINVSLLCSVIKKEILRT